MSTRGGSKEVVICILIAAGACLYLFLIPPEDIPLHDSVIYYEEVRRLLAEGEIWVFPTNEVTAVLQILYGALFAGIFGLNHAVLIGSTMLLAAISVAETYIWLRRWHSSVEAVWGSLILLAQPLFYGLSHTFMTDIPSLVFIIPAVMFFYLGVLDDKNSYLIVGGIFAVIGFWVRQFSILPVFGVLLYFLIFERGAFTKRSRAVTIVVFLLALPLLSVLVWLTQFRAPGTYPLHVAIVPPLSFIRNLTRSFVYVGSFFFPLGIVYLINCRRLISDLRQLNRASKLLVAALVGGPILLAVYYYGIFIKEKYGVTVHPFTYTYIGPIGVGPDLISGAKPLLYPDLLWIPMFTLSLVAAFGLAVHVLRRIGGGDRRFLVLSLLVVSVILPIAAVLWDDHRHYLPVVPLLLPLVVSSVSRLRGYKFLVVILVVLFSFWSVYGTYEYMGWNRVRWEGINYLLESGVPEYEIDGGMEYDARFLLEPYNTPREEAVNWHGWAYSISDKYLISFSQLHEYRVLKEIGYYGPFGEKLGSIYVLEKYVQL
ncbi:MAG: glycosyltransferase family 39 protein [Candidatus Bathyarchaeia archaeon]